MERLKKCLAIETEVKDLGQIRYFLVMEIARSKKGISVSQMKYILDLLTENGMLGCKPIDRPIEAGKITKDFENSIEIDKKLIYLFPTRPHIAFAVSICTLLKKLT